MFFNSNITVLRQSAGGYNDDARKGAVYADITERQQKREARKNLQRYAVTARRTDYGAESRRYLMA